MVVCMLDVGLVGVLAVWVIAVGWRALCAAPRLRHPIRFAIVAAVSAAIHLGFHAAATAAPTLDAVALVLAGWTTFGLWCLWLGRLPSRGFRQNEDDGPSDGGGGGRRGPTTAGRTTRRPAAATTSTGTCSSATSPPTSRLAPRRSAELEPATD